MSALEILRIELRVLRLKPRRLTALARSSAGKQKQTEAYAQPKTTNHLGAGRRSMRS